MVWVKERGGEVSSPKDHRNWHVYSLEFKFLFGDSIDERVAREINVQSSYEYVVCFVRKLFEISMRNRLYFKL